MKIKRYGIPPINPLAWGLHAPKPPWDLSGIDPLNNHKAHQRGLSFMSFMCYLCGVGNRTIRRVILFLGGCFPAVPPMLQIGLKLITLVNLKKYIFT